jgi:YggT family protein
MGIVIALLDIVQMLLWVLSILIIAQAVFSWLVVFNVINTSSPFVRAVWTALEKITEPLYRPIRRIMPDFGGIDFSPIVVLLLIWVISRLLGGVELDLQRSYYMGA